MLITKVQAFYQWQMELEVGLNTALIQQFTLKNCVECHLKRIQEKFDANPSLYLTNPKQLIVASCKDNKETGSSTIVVTTLDPLQLKLHTAFLGDSGYMIFRRNDFDAKKLDIVFRSEEQQHSFNFPYQVGTNGDNPATAVVQSHDLLLDDIVLLGTDGVFDNLFNLDIIKDLEGFLAGNEFDATLLAQTIAKSAFAKSLDPKWQSPFAVNAKGSGYRFKGGKSDDITVIIARLESEDVKNN